VQQKQLDSIIRNSRPTVAKLDVEDYEEEVLRGGRALLVSESFQVIQLETVTPGNPRYSFRASIPKSVLRSVQALIVNRARRLPTV
jgi:hypothetical protein